MKTRFAFAFAIVCVAITSSALAQGKLLLSEATVTPTAGEFVEIYNPTSSAVDLTNYYITDATFQGGSVYYYNIVTGSDAGGGGFADWHAQFPAGASIAPGEVQTLTLNGSIGFQATYGIDPTYELFEDDVSADSIPDMLEALPGSINSQGGLTNSGEFVALYTWDGVSDLVQDVDYLTYVDTNEGVDKTGIMIDGPDGDSVTSSYLPDTSFANQDPISGTHTGGNSFNRIDFTEGTQTMSGGNGILGSDETSENLSATWSFDQLATPGTIVPEPNGMALFGMGALLFSLIGTRRHRN